MASSARWRRSIETASPPERHQLEPAPPPLELPPEKPEDDDDDDDDNDDDDHEEEEDDDRVSCEVYRMCVLTWLQLTQLSRTSI